ncbi:trimeric intracellular cation channel family protein [Alteraurantiacibacter aquimixticola]|uniref:Trimeric intracellular cation channel family protein n=1 Tax=Alteraurantiacibacter aquimixticola TaxID=2489173 RepID=A0A4T3F7E1_9SPHN|nr:trimeric intracellular cation channel family protein [Alteraurantiacibacter aquimixticola]
MLDLAGTAVFALTGASLAARLQQTFVTACFFALVTGVGGGTIRDLLLDANVFWLRDPWIAPVILGTALVAWFTPNRWWQGQLIEWADAAGLAAFSVLGTAKALTYGVAPIPAMILGVVTGCAGGIIRDVVAGVPSIMMRPDLYVTAAALSAMLTALLLGLGVTEALTWAIAALAGFALRGAAMIWNIQLPAYSRGSDPG